MHSAHFPLRIWFLDDQAHAGAEHPVQCCFIELAGVSTMLAAIYLRPYSIGASWMLFAIGSLFTASFALWRTGILWKGARDPATTTPVLYLPIVAGSFTTAMAVPALRPTLGIQLAPPGVGCAAYMTVTTGTPDIIAHAMLGYAILQARLLLRLLPWILKQPFAASFFLGGHVRSDRRCDRRNPELNGAIQARCQRSPPSCSWSPMSSFLGLRSEQSISSENGS